MPKNIRIFLEDGTVTGLKIGEIVTTTIQSISCPRNKIVELRNNPEAKRPGVYFLLGQDEVTNEPKAYIGEAENIYDRLQNHISNKDFWNEVIFFVSKDDFLTKAHIKYLESKLIEIALSTKRYKIENSNRPQIPLLPRADISDMGEFLIYIKLLIGVMGHKLLESVAIQITKKEEISYSLHPETLNSEFETIISNLELSLSVSGYKAKALQTDEGIVVLRGSEASKDSKDSLPKGYLKIKQRLIDNGILKLEGDRYIFQSDELFNTASPAAAIIVGYSISGPEVWKDKKGKTLKEIEKERLNS